MLNFAIRAHNAAHKLLWPYSTPAALTPELREIQDRAIRFRSDISDHLPTLFSESIAMRPRLIVELGVRGGESRFVFERVAKLNDSFLVSVDMDDCSAACSPASKWYFLKADDVLFAQEFPAWCGEHGVSLGIDVLFIDTSHLYDHTVEEIRGWFSHLNPKSKVIFHDTNLRKLGRRMDGTLLRGWDNDRGVIRAIEDFLGARLNERVDFVTTINQWVVRHWARCNGLTVLERVPGQAPVHNNGLER